MAYVAPSITAAGLVVPSYNDIQAALLTQYQACYGATTALGNDNADYQWISALALKLNDAMSLCQLAYNGRSPLTAVGADLDAVVELNGLARLTSAPSSVVLTLTGVADTVINNGVVSDVNGILWSLPTTVTIGAGGTITATAVCQQQGQITAAAGTVNTPVGGFTAGWTGVTNAAPAVVGAPVEADSGLRARQVVSVALPSETRLAGTTAEVKAVSGVTRTNILENQAGTTDSYGNLGHSLTCVVEGGTDLAVATAIFTNRGIGCNTQGATVPAMTIVPVTDPNSGNITDIGFVRPVYEAVYIGIAVHGLTAGYTTATQAAIVAALVAYLNSLSIGEEVTQSALYFAAGAVNASQTQPTFSIRALTLGLSASGLFTAVPDVPGTGYTVGNVVTVVQGGASGGTLTVAAVNGSGGVTAFNGQATAAGAGYSVATGLATTGGAGTGLTVNITGVAPITTADISLLFYQVALGVAAQIALASV